MSVKILVFILLLTIVAVHVEADAFVGACNQVCPRIQRERDECCRAHGFNGGMVPGWCNPLLGAVAYCKS
ncbi:hypothetical protein PRIPAC_78675 [Pristionchus pacificus]|uniref:Uncharacterized protein n=1 Tax=Pristionchus pacificus TaxID=54126 RepID=A0A2A6CLZ3_PRIPA|nr:hypothetical protein PRIPAC_78675 [Pristionchus pacificus]|eukprot:PDM79222.1 hypothetical protein PRIPAC_31801 [Pristionchus pacificus]